MDIHKIAKYERITEQNIIKLTKEANDRKVKMQAMQIINEEERFKKEEARYIELK